VIRKIPSNRWFISDSTVREPVLRKNFIGRSGHAEELHCTRESFMRRLPFGSR